MSATTMCQNPSTPSTEQPDPALIRAICPWCKTRPVVSQMTYTEGRGYLLKWVCFGKQTGECEFSMVL